MAHVAAKQGRANILQWLNSAALFHENDENRFGQTVAQIAAQQDNKEILQWLESIHSDSAGVEGAGQ